MKRRHISTRERVQIFADAKGICHLCGAPIMPGQAWDIEHVVPLSMGGDDHGENLKPAHAACHREKTRAEAGPRAKAVARSAAHIGAKAPSRTPLPFGKRSKWKRKMDGRIVPR